MINEVPFYHYEHAFLEGQLDKARNKVMQLHEYAILSINEGDEEGFSRRLDIRGNSDSKDSVEEIVAYAKAKLPDEFSSIDEILGKLIEISRQYPEKEKYENRTDTEYYGFEKQVVAEKSDTRLVACRVWVYTAYL